MTMTASASWMPSVRPARRRTGRCHAYCLMPNHFHLVLETPQPNLVAGMKWLLGTYTSRHNRRHKEFGHLFSGRYKALRVDGSTTGDSYDAALADCQSAIRFHVETFGAEAAEGEPPVLEAFIAEARA